MKIQAIAVNTYREAIRNKIIYSVLLFAVLLIGISTLFGSITIGNQVNVIKDFGLFSVSFFGVVITIICGVSLLNKELKQKTVYNILSKPVARWQFILGKHLGLSLTVGFLVTLMGLGLTCYVSIFEQRFEWLMLYGILFTVLEVIVVAAVALFFSSLVVTTTLTGIFTMATYVAGRSISYMQHFLDQRSESYDPIVSRVVYVFDWILPDLSLFNVNDQIVYGQAMSPQYLALAVLYCLAYTTVALGLATLIFERRELT